MKPNTSGRFPSFFFLLIVLVSFLGWAACAKSTLLGSDLFENEQLDFVFDSTFTLDVRNEITDSILVSHVTDPNDTVLIGNIDDPVFGETEAYLNTQFLPPFDMPFLNNDSIVLDSLVLAIAYDSTAYRRTATYGDTSQPFTLQAFQLSEIIPFKALYYSNETYRFDENKPLGETTFLPFTRTKADFPVLDSVRGGNKDSSAHVRILLDANFMRSLKDTTLYSKSRGDENLNFTNLTKGLVIKAEGKTKAMVGFNMDRNASRLLLYYHKDTIKSAVQYYLSSRNAANLSVRVDNVKKVNTFKHNYTNTKIPAALNNRAAADSTLYIQGMNGPRVKVVLPDFVAKTKKILINKAELILTVDPTSVDEWYRPVDTMVLSRKLPNGLDVNIIDVQRGLIQNSLSIYNGLPQKVTIDGKVYFQYKLNITEHLLLMSKEVVGNEFFIQNLNRTSRVGRIAAFGPKSSLLPLKLNLTYTKIP